MDFEVGFVRFAAEPRDTTQASDHAQKNGADEGEGHSRSQDVQLVGDVHQAPPFVNERKTTRIGRAAETNSSLQRRAHLYHNTSIVTG
ncbi:hypothetical protein [Blastochloris tepida]|uniref:hypothetical protein n=1 Tax=Blastochloris tepida TaxID=2233851 RepID=UPI000F82C2C5|nr:hypothetical protein [Blastochloris tepida]